MISGELQPGRCYRRLFLQNEQAPRATQEQLIQLHQWLQEGPSGTHSPDQVLNLAGLLWTPLGDVLITLRPSLCGRWAVTVEEVWCVQSGLNTIKT